MANKEAVADAIDIDAIMRSVVTKAEKAYNLQPVFLNRSSFAKSAVSTGSLCIDKILGGGIPPSRIIGIVGPERAGKSLLTTQIAHNQLEANGYGCLFDAEGASDPGFLAARGIDFSKFLGARNKNNELKPKEVDKISFYQPTTVEQIANYIHAVSAALPENRNPETPFRLYLLDSVVALITDELSGDLDSNKMSIHARAYATYLPIINSDLLRSGCSLVYTNQMRLKPMVKFGPNTYEPCGEALKFFSSIRMQLGSSKPKLFDKDHPFLEKAFIPEVEPKAGGEWREPHHNSDGTENGLDKYIYTSVKTIKNKVYSPFQSTWMRIQFSENGSTGRGIDPVFDVFTFLAELYYIKPLQKTEKTVHKSLYQTYYSSVFNPVKELGMPDVFNYLAFKRWVDTTPKIVAKIRKLLLETGYFENEYEMKECEAVVLDCKPEKEEEKEKEKVENIESNDVILAEEKSSSKKAEQTKTSGKGRPKK